MAKDKSSALGDAVLSRLRIAVDQAGGPSEVARRAHIPLRTLQHWMSGNSEPRAGGLAEVAAVAGFSMDWLLLGYDSNATRISSDMAYVPRWGMCAGGDGNRLPTDEDVEEVVALPVWWLNRVGAVAASTRLMGVAGDDMAPTIPSDALVLIDVADREVVNRRGVFVFRLPDDDYPGLQIRQLEHDFSSSKLTVRSHNALFEPRLLPRSVWISIEVVGRVRAVLAPVR